jgi:hypothetical protein
MPEGLLESLTSQQIQDLFAFVLSGHEPQLARQPSQPKEPDADGTSAEPAATSGPQ